MRPLPSQFLVGGLVVSNLLSLALSAWCFATVRQVSHSTSVDELVKALPVKLIAEKLCEIDDERARLTRVAFIEEMRAKSEASSSARAADARMRQETEQATAVAKLAAERRATSDIVALRFAMKLKDVVSAQESFNGLPFDRGRLPWPAEAISAAEKVRACQKAANSVLREVDVRDFFANVERTELGADHSANAKLLQRLENAEAAGAPAAQILLDAFGSRLTELQETIAN